jgi:hypothetical protein
MKVNRKTFLSWSQTVEELDEERIFTETYSKTIKGKEYSVNINIDKIKPGSNTKGPKSSQVGFEISENKKECKSDTKSLFEKRRKF